MTSWQSSLDEVPLRRVSSVEWHSKQVLWPLSGWKKLTGQGAQIDTATPQGKLVFGIFAALAEFERDLISEKTTAGLKSARARGRKGGASYKMTAAKLRLAMASMASRDTHIGNLCKELGITRQTLYRHVSPTGELRVDGKKLMEKA